MITSMNLYPINIPVGTQINSNGALMFYNHPLDTHLSRMHSGDPDAYFDDVSDECHSEWRVGYALTVSRPLYKLHVVERIGPMEMHRFYLTDDVLRDKGQYIPIYTKIYSTGSAQLLVYRAGITEIWKRYTPEQFRDIVNPEFVNSKMANILLSNQLGIQYHTEHFDAWKQYRHLYCPYSSDIDNGWQFMADPEYDPYSDYVWQHNPDIYDYNTDVYNEQYDFMGNIANYLDGSQGRYDSPSGLVTCDALDYSVPKEYTPVSIDKVTRRDLSNPIVHISQILNGTRRRSGNYTPPIAFISNPVNVFEYDASILELCTILTHSDYVEITCTYTLSTGELHISDFLSMTDDARNGNHTQLSSSLSLTFSRWGYPEVVALITKTYHDILNLSLTVCHADGSIDSRTYTIDLSVIQVINHNLTT